MNNRFKAKTITLSLFLSTILVIGTVTSLFPTSSSFMTVNAQTQSYYGIMDNYKLKDNTFSLNKIKCINDNININGVNSGNISIGNKGQVEPSAASSFGNDGERYNGYSDGYINNKKDKGFDCIVNNDNENRQVTTTIPPTPPSIDNNVYAVWQDNTPGNAEIFFAVSDDNGLNFSMPVNLSNSAGASFNPEISTEGNNVYVVWEDNTPGNAEIFFTVSTDNGQTFSMPVNLSNSAGSSVFPQILTEENNVYVVWQDNISDNREIFFAVSTDNGQTFSMPENISNNAGQSTNPQISSEGNNVYVVWQDTIIFAPDIFFAVSTDNGQTFSMPENISNNAGLPGVPQISSEGNNVYVVWQDNTSGNFDIFFAASSDNGQTFSMPENLSNNVIGSFDPQISSEGNNVYVVWQDNTPGNAEIFFAVSDDNGLNFSTPENLSNNAGISFGLQISTEGNNVYVVWEDNTPGNLDIFFAVSTDNGQTFSMPANLSNSAGSSVSPEISTEGNNVYVIWQDDFAEIFFAVSNNNGQTFSTPAENLSNNAGFSFNPEISSSTS